MLGRLERDVDARLRAELPRPHAGAVDDVLGLDVAERACWTPVTTPRLWRKPGDGDALEDRRPLHARPLRERHRDVDRVRAAVFLHVEAGEDVVGPREREELLHLGAAEISCTSTPQ